MALKTLNEIRGLQDPLKQSQAEFVITETPALLLAKLQQKAVGIISGNSGTASAKDLRLRCTSFSYPTTKVKQSTLTIGKFTRKHGTIQDKSGIWRCKVTEDQEGGVLNIIQSWCDLIHNSITGISLPSVAYIGTASVILDGLKGKRTVWLKGFYPIGYTVNEIDPSSSNPIDIDISFNYDYFVENSYSLFALMG